MQQQNMIVAGPGRAPLLDFSSFEYYDSFHKNVQNFLLTRGAGFSLPGGLKGWLIPLICGGHLHVYEEQIGESNCICDQCRIIGNYLRARL